MLEVKHVTKAYAKDGTPAIEDISFTVEPGKIHGLIGPNGSGKTTLIKCITGILSTTEGEILLDGEPVYDNPKVKERIGYVADNCNFFLNYKVKDMIKFYQGMYGKFEEEEFHKLNEMFEIPLKRRIGHLSKGQKMRLSFMLNMAMKPEILVMDEPTSGLDAMAKADLLEQIIAKVDYEDTAVIISTHHLHELEKICDTVTMMNIGGIQYQGELDDVKENIQKYQVVFKGGISQGVLEHENIVNYSNIGSVYTFLWKGKEDAAEYFLSQGADLAEQTDISLEEVFIYSNRRRRGE
ncbi:MAG: ABC transporter ATP-binding protein [Clostridiales bacterium]|nr:ABC transporter ATP-binding protein [Eubacterium sp.]MDD7350471.1 ABC transporter ATP-binding protein [Clostridiales bacterium]